MKIYCQYISISSCTNLKRLLIPRSELSVKYSDVVKTKKTKERIITEEWKEIIYK